MRSYVRFGFAILIGGVYASFTGAQVPPPPPPMQQPTVNVRVEFRRMASEACIQKAMDALANKENFIFAEVGKDGSAWGYNETCVVRVFALPFKDGANLFVVCGGKEKLESERLCNAIWTHIVEAPADPQMPKSHRSNDSSRKPCGLHLRSSWEQRNTIGTVRLFVPAALIVMEKNGLTTNPVGPGLVLGAHQGSQSLVAVFGAQGPNEANTQIGAAAISSDENEAERLHNAIRSGIVKVLFD